MPGIVIIAVTPSGQAEQLGLRVHDVIFRCDGVQIDGAEDLMTAREQNDVNELTVIRGRELIEVKASRGSLGVSLVPYPIQDTILEGVGEVIARFAAESTTAVQLDKKEQQDRRDARIANVQITTAPTLEGYRVTRTVDIVSAEYVGGMNMFRDIMANVTDLIGFRSGTMQNELRKARELCLKNLKAEADRLGANAVIAVDLDYSEISGGGKSMLFLVASGTAVIVESAS